MNFLPAITLSLLLINLQSYAVILISFGGDCTAAGMLREFGFRKAAYPFDWMFSHSNHIYEALSDDFKHFLEPETLKVSGDDSMVIDYYGFAFVHDFPTIHHGAALNESEEHQWAKLRADWRNFIPAIKAKYQRRIDRLREALNGSDHVVIVRYSMDKDEAVRFRELLLQRYPNLNFTLVAAVNTQEYLPNWNLDRIRNFTIPYSSADFKARWHNIFTTLRIQPQQARSFIEDDEMACDGSCCRFMRSVCSNY